MTNIPIVSRRRLLGNVSAVAAASVPVAATAMGGLAAAVTDDPDAELVQLVGQWLAASRDMDRAYEAPDVPRSPAYFAALDRRYEHEYKILEMPARTLAGIAAKARIVARPGDPYLHFYDLSRAMARDVLALTAVA